MSARAMLGAKEAWGDRSCQCCFLGKGKRAWKRAEERSWRAEAAQEARVPAEPSGEEPDECGEVPPRR